MNGDESYRCTAVAIYDKSGKLIRQIAVDADGTLAEPSRLADGERMFAVMSGPRGPMLGPISDDRTPRLAPRKTHRPEPQV